MEVHSIVIIYNFSDANLCDAKLFLGQILMGQNCYGAKLNDAKLLHGPNRARKYKKEINI